MPVLFCDAVTLERHFTALFSTVFEKAFVRSVNNYKRIKNQIVLTGTVQDCL